MDQNLSSEKFIFWISEIILFLTKTNWVTFSKTHVLLLCYSESIEWKIKTHFFKIHFNITIPYTHITRTHTVRYRLLMFSYATLTATLSGVVTDLGRPGRGALQLEKSPGLKWATQFLTGHTMVRVRLMFLSEWREFSSVPCLTGKKLDYSSRLDVEIVRVAWHASFQPL